MNWRQDLPTEKQLRFLLQLGCSATPRSKGEAADWIAARVPKPRMPDPAEIIDKAAELAMRSLANESYYQEIGGVLMRPENPYQGPLAGYERHGTPISVHRASAGPALR